MSGVYITPTSTLAKFAGAVEKAHSRTGLRPTHAFLHFDDFELLIGNLNGVFASIDGPIFVYGVQVTVSSAVKRGKILFATEADLEYE